MKKRLTVFGLIFIALQACHKDPATDEFFLPGKQEFGTWQAEKLIGLFNSRPWQASGSALFSRFSRNYIDIEAVTYDDLYQFREDLILFEIPAALGTYIIPKGRGTYKDSIPNASYFRLISDGGVLGAAYFPDWGLRPNYVKVTEIDTLQKKIKGEFELTFKISRAGDYYPDFVSFRKGKFDVDILK